MIAVRLNGSTRELAADSTVADAVSLLTQAPVGVAVALDDGVVPRTLWPTTALYDGARVEVLTAVQGG